MMAFTCDGQLEEGKIADRDRCALPWQSWRKRHRRFWQPSLGVVLGLMAAFHTLG